MTRQLLAAVALFTCGGLAYAHGSAAWIEAQPFYKSPNGSKCCGPRDCEPVPAGEVQQLRDGWYIPSTRQFLTLNDPGVFLSEDSRYWWCRRNTDNPDAKKVVCLFVKPPGA